jgi:hypothetical protein
MINLKSSEEAQRDLGEYVLFGTIRVYTIEPLPEEIDLHSVLQTIEKKIPKVFFHDIDSIFIGQFKEFVERGINAFYSDGAIFVTNHQDDEQDLMDDIVHETAHSVERMFPEHIYDESLEQEFLLKRKTLFSRLKAEDWKLDFEDFLEVKYSPEFDNMLYMEIGYPLLASLTFDLFNSPYAVTSLQEYWANGFEGFFTKDPYRIKSVSPQVYKKITTLIDNHS